VDIELTWNQYGLQLKRFIASKVPDLHVAEELTQELLVKSYQNLHSLRDETRVEAWLYRLAQNVVRDYYRKRAHDGLHNAVDINDLADFLEQEDSNDDVHKSLSHCIQPFVEQLPDKYRNTLTEVDLNRVSQKQLAERLGMPHSTVKSQVQRGREKLKHTFERCCNFSIDTQGNIIDYTIKANNCEDNCACNTK